MKMSPHHPVPQSDVVTFSWHTEMWGNKGHPSKCSHRDYCGNNQGRSYLAPGPADRASGCAVAVHASFLSLYPGKSPASHIVASGNSELGKASGKQSVKMLGKVRHASLHLSLALPR